MKLTRKIISLILLIAMLFTAAAVSASAATYDFSNVKAYWNNEFAGSFGYSTTKDGLWYLAQHYYGDKLISDSCADGDGYDNWQSIPASKMTSLGKYKVVLSVFENYNALNAYKNGSSTITPLYKTTISKDFTSAKRIQAPTNLSWSNDRQSVSFSAVSNAAAYFIDARKIYGDGSTVPILFDSFPVQISDECLTTKDGTVTVNLSKFLTKYSCDPVTYDSSVKDVVFSVIAIPNNGGSYFNSLVSKTCYYNGTASSNTENSNTPAVNDWNDGEPEETDNIIPMYCKVGDIDDPNGLSSGIGTKAGGTLSGIEFYLDLAGTQKITSGLMFPGDAGTFTKTSTGKYNWSAANAFPGEYKIYYNANGKAYSLNVYVHGSSTPETNTPVIEDEESLIDISDCTISKVTKTYTYTGKGRTLKITLVDPNGKTLISGEDYKITYKNNINIGTATATIKGIGNYQGSRTVSMTIKLKTPVVNSVSGGVEKLTAKWDTVTGADGYQVKYSRKSNMSEANSKSFSGAMTTSGIVRSLKGNYKYYVQVRAYKLVDGKRKYSDWSSKKITSVSGTTATYKYEMEDNRITIEGSHHDVLLNCYRKKVKLNGNTDAIKRINARIDKEFPDFGKQINTFRNASDPEGLYIDDAAGDNEYGNCEYDDYTTSKVTYCDNSVISIKITNYWFAGGVVNTGSYGLTFDLKTGNQLYLDDVCRGTSGEIKNSIAAVMKKDEYVWEYAISEMRATKLHKLNFYLKPDKRCMITFGPYEAGAGGYGREYKITSKYK